LINRNANIEKIKKHFRSLSPESLRRRYGFVLGSDDAIDQHVERFVSDDHHLFAIFDLSGDIIGFSQAAPDPHHESEFELGISILDDHQGKGYGRSLFKTTVNFITALGAKRIFTNCLGENKAMQHLAKSEGMKVVIQYGDASGELVPSHDRTPVETASLITELITNNNLMLIDLAIKGTISNIDCSVGFLTKLTKSLTFTR
jgi:RimJ/RimL family protein N-acetyltransferase